MSGEPTHGAAARAAKAARLVVAAAVAGLGLGVGARLLMRLIALEAGLPGSYSLGGSVDVVLFGLLLGGPIAAGFWLIRPRLAWRRPFAGVALGTMLLALFALLPPASARSALAGTPDTPLFTLLGFGLLLIGWGAALELVARPARARSGRSRGGGGPAASPPER